LVGDAIVCKTPSPAIADDCAALRAKVDTARSARSTAYVSFGAAGVLAAGTLITYLVWPGSRSSSAAWTLGPWRRKGGGSGVTIEGTF